MLSKLFRWTRKPPEAWWAELCHDGTVSRIATSPEQLYESDWAHVVRVDSMAELQDLMIRARRDFEKELGGQHCIGCGQHPDECECGYNPEEEKLILDAIDAPPGTTVHVHCGSQVFESMK